MYVVCECECKCRSMVVEDADGRMNLKTLRKGVGRDEKKRKHRGSQKERKRAKIGQMTKPTERKKTDGRRGAKPKVAYGLNGGGAVIPALRFEHEHERANGTRYENAQEKHPVTKYEIKMRKKDRGLGLGNVSSCEGM